MPRHSVDGRAQKVVTLAMLATAFLTIAAATNYEDHDLRLVR